MVRCIGRAVALGVPLISVAAESADAQFVERPKLVVVQDTGAFGFAGGDGRTALRPGQRALALLEDVLAPDCNQLHEYLGNEILNRFGGLNVTLTRHWHYLHDDRPGEEGLSLNVGTTANAYTPAMHMGGSAEFRIKLTECPSAGAEP